MKAVVMAGGFGTRLRPLTEKLPKPMAYVANRPMMEHVVRLLKRSGITDLEVLLYFYPDKITSYFGDGSPWGVRMNYIGAESDYGTAGAVKNAESRIDGTFLVISADIITDFDLSRSIEFHQEREAAATIVLTRVTNPLQYGIVITEEDGRIERFLEKPSWGEVFSDTVNTGIYILEPEVLSLIPEGKSFDFSKNVFPEMLSRGDRLLGYIAEGYWKDVGNLDEYLNVHLDILSGKVGIEFDGRKVGSGNVWIGENSRVDFTSDLQNVVIGKDCVVGANVSAENVVLGDGCIVEDGAVLQSSVVWPRTTIHKGVRLLENIIGSDCVIRGRAFLAERAVISDHCIIGTEAVVKERQGVAAQGGRGRRGPLLLAGVGGEMGAVPVQRLRHLRARQPRDHPRVRRQGRRGVRGDVREKGRPVHEPGQPQDVADDQPGHHDRDAVGGGGRPRLRRHAAARRPVPRPQPPGGKGRGPHAEKPLRPVFRGPQVFRRQRVEPPPGHGAEHRASLLPGGLRPRGHRGDGGDLLPRGGVRYVRRRLPQGHRRENRQGARIQHRARPLLRFLGPHLSPDPRALGRRDGRAQRQPRRGANHEDGRGVPKRAFPPDGDLPVPLRGLRGDDRHRRGEDLPGRREGGHPPGLDRPPGILPPLLPAEKIP